MSICLRFNLALNYKSKHNVGICCISLFSIPVHQMQQPAQWPNVTKYDNPLVHIMKSLSKAVV